VSLQGSLIYTEMKYALSCFFLIVNMKEIGLITDKEYFTLPKLIIIALSSILNWIYGYL